MSEPYKCPGCRKWFYTQAGPVHFSCCVLHAPGECCHYGEMETTVPPPPKGIIANYLAQNAERI